TADETHGHGVEVAAWLRPRRQAGPDRPAREAPDANEMTTAQPGISGTTSRLAVAAGAGPAVLFRDDDAGYLRWLRAHPAGFALTGTHSVSPSYLMLPRAGCRTITGRPTAGTVWTRDYIKVCADRRCDLEQWILSRLGVHPTLCQICRP